MGSCNLGSSRVLASKRDFVYLDFLFFKWDSVFIWFLAVSHMNPEMDVSLSTTLFEISQ